MRIGKKEDSFTQSRSNLKNNQIEKIESIDMPIHFKTFSKFDNKNREHSLKQFRSFYEPKSNNLDELIKFGTNSSKSIIRYSQNLSKITKKENNNLKQKLNIFKHIKEKMLFKAGKDYIREM